MPKKERPISQYEIAIDIGVDTSKFEKDKAEDILHRALKNLPKEVKKPFPAIRYGSMSLDEVLLRLAFYLGEWLPDPHSGSTEVQPNSGLVSRCIFNAVEAVVGYRGGPMDCPQLTAYFKGLLKDTPSIVDWIVWSPLVPHNRRASGYEIKTKIASALPKPPKLIKPPDGLDFEVWEPLLTPMSRWVTQRRGRAPYMYRSKLNNNLSDDEIRAMIACRIFGVRHAAQIGLGDLIGGVIAQSSKLRVCG